MPLNHFRQANATLRGAEASIEGEVAPHIVLGAQGDFVRGTLAGGENVPFIPPARLGVRGRWDNGHFSLGGDVRRAMKQDKVSGGDVDVPADAYTLLNFSAGWSMVSGGTTERYAHLGDDPVKRAADRAASDIADWLRHGSAVAVNTDQKTERKQTL